MNPKKILIVMIAVLYGLLSLLLFSETLIVQLIEAEKAYYLKESKNFKQITFTQQDWESLEDKQEFKLKGHFYDVKKIAVSKNKITVTVLKDDYENLIKFISKNISPKNKKSKALKGKRNFEVCSLQIIPTVFPLIKKNIKQRYYYYITHSNPYTTTIFHPPCM
jgi:hypothetical protein